MPDQFLKPKLNWPRWSWRDSGWWLTVFGAVFAAVMFILPSTSKHPVWLRLLISLAWFLLSSIAILAVEHLVKTCAVTVNRLRAYSDLYDIAELRTRQVTRAQETILELSQELTSSRRFEIEKTLYYSEVLYLVLKKKRGAKLEVGHKIRVIDIQEGGIMGVFVVTEIRSNEYRARATDYVDPLWLGFVRQNGKAETPAPPNGGAFFMPKDENDDK